MTPDFLGRLAAFADRDRRPGAEPRSAVPALWSFVAHDRERLTDIRLDRTALITVIEGVKEFDDALGGFRFPAGTAMLLPAGWSGTVVNEPDAGSGLYRALVLEFPVDLVRRLLRAHPRRATGCPAGPRDHRVSLTPHLIEAMLHAASGLTAGIGPALAEHRCMEVLLILLEDGVCWFGPGVPVAASDAVRQLVRTRPQHAWTADALGREMGLGAATLRRRLAEEGTSLRHILREERVAHARHLLETEGLSVQQAAEAAGYASRSHFARRVRAATGTTPSGLRRT